MHNAEAGTAISDLIAAWYPGGLGSGAPIQPTPPSGWSGHESDYHNVFAKSCRTCHVARDEGNPSNYFLFADFPGFTGTSYAVCGTDSPRRVMPNAIVTYKNFWTDSLRVLQYETSIVQPTGTCGN